MNNNENKQHNNYRENQPQTIRKDERRHFKFSYQDIADYLKISYSSVKQAVFKHQIIINDLEEFINFVNFMKSKQYIELFSERRHNERKMKNKYKKTGKIL